MNNIQTIINIHNSIFETFPNADKITENNITYPYLQGFHNDTSSFELYCDNETKSYELTNELFQLITQHTIEEYLQLTQNL